MYFKHEKNGLILAIGQSEVITNPFEEVTESEYYELLAQIKDRAAVVNDYVKNLKFEQGDMSRKDYEKQCEKVCKNIPKAKEDKDYFKVVQDEVYDVLVSLYVEAENESELESK